MQPISRATCVAIGRELARMYAGMLEEPLPEELVALVKQIEAKPPGWR